MGMAQERGAMETLTSFWLGLDHPSRGTSGECCGVAPETFSERGLHLMKRLVAVSTASCMKKLKHSYSASIQKIVQRFYT